MSLTLHIEAASVAELIAEAQKFIGGGIGKALLPMEEVAVGSATITDPATMKGKPGRPSKPKMEEAIAANTAQAAQPLAVANVEKEKGKWETTTLPAADPFAAEIQAPAVHVTFEDVKSALQKLAVLREGEKDPQVGYNRVGAIISKFGVDKVKNLKPEQYAAVLEACGQA